MCFIKNYTKSETTRLPCFWPRKAENAQSFFSYKREALFKSYICAHFGWSFLEAGSIEFEKSRD